MHRIDCPWCGIRDEAEFQYQGDATKTRPEPVASPDDDPAAPTEETRQAFFDYVYLRDNPRGWHTEWWHHVQGCRQWVKVVRNTLTHEIHATGGPQSTLGKPNE